MHLFPPSNVPLQDQRYLIAANYVELRRIRRLAERLERKFCEVGPCDLFFMLGDLREARKALVKQLRMFEVPDFLKVPSEEEPPTDACCTA